MTEILPVEHVPRSENGPTNKSQLHVLLIEDSEDAQLLVHDALEEHGNGKYRLNWACTLSDGLDELAKGHTDIVLLDLGLPECSGAASYAKLREIAPRVPVVVLSGDMTEETQVSVIGGGAQDYLGKQQMSGPLLVEAIRSALCANKQRK
jgi:DNA-binding response OmpR family regulator